MASSLEDLFAASEVLFECEALTPVTAGAVTRALLGLLPPDAVFVNVGRGGLVDEAALVELARDRRLRVAVDVLQQEPATPGSPLCQVPGVVVSPHIAGPTREEYPAVGKIALENVRRYEAGLPLANLVTLETYDRST